MKQSPNTLQVLILDEVFKIKKSFSWELFPDISALIDTRSFHSPHHTVVNTILFRSKNFFWEYIFDNRGC
jgi:hypothetical protein